MPRPRKPAAMLRLTGSRRKRRDEALAGPVGPWRTGSTDPAAIWDELLACAPPGLLTASDRPALELATLMIGTMRADPATLTASRCAAISNLLSRLGMTPSGRGQLAVPEPEPEPNPFLEFLPTTSSSTR